MEWGRPQMTIWRMRIAWLVPKTTNTHSQYVTLTAFPLQQWLHERASMPRYTYIDCVVRLSQWCCSGFHSFCIRFSVVGYSVTDISKDHFAFTLHGIEQCSAVCGPQTSPKWNVNPLDPCHSSDHQHHIISIKSGHKLISITS